MKSLIVTVQILLIVACGSRGGGGDQDTATDEGTDVTEDEVATNSPPSITTTAPTEADVYEVISYQVVCTDPDGDELSITEGEDDTCGGDLTDAGDGTAFYELALEPDMEGSTCTLAIQCSDGAEQDVQSTDLTVGPAAAIDELNFSDLEPWSTPIDDYIEAATTELGHTNFMTDIFDMAVFDEKLYFGYGDANENLGRVTPIEIRFWDIPDPDGWTSGFAVDEEQVSRYRVYGDLLLVPGIDATEDGLMGNAYNRPLDGEWTKSRTLDLGWHVHDMVVHQDAIHACGSGGTQDDYDNSTVNSFIWRSDDGGETFTIQVQTPHPSPPGDNRLVHLISAAGQLYAFGYFSDDTYSYAANYRVFGDTLTEFTAMPQFFVDDAWSLAGDRAIIKGVNIGDPLTSGTLLLMGTSATHIDDLFGQTTLDVMPLGEARGLVMYHEGDTYPPPEATSWNVHLAIFNMDRSLVDIHTQTLETYPVSVAFWRRELYVGMADGSVWRAVGR